MNNKSHTSPSNFHNDVDKITSLIVTTFLLVFYMWLNAYFSPTMFSPTPVLQVCVCVFFFNVTILSSDWQRPVCAPFSQKTRKATTGLICEGRYDKLPFKQRFPGTRTKKFDVRYLRTALFIFPRCRALPHSPFPNSQKHLQTYSQNHFLFYRSYSFSTKVNLKRSNSLRWT